MDERAAARVQVGAPSAQRNHASGTVKQPIKSATDEDREYRALTLDNGLSVLLVSEPNTDKAAAALDVRVGAFADTEDFYGLAHFCEHMLFLGTEKYPEENKYSSFLAQHGGRCNAYTDSESTNYHFEVTKEHLAGALDIFAQFFLAPLFTLSCTEREMNAVNSENDKNLQDDSRRIRQVMKTLSSPQCPWKNFSTGNLETLNKPGIREALLRFHSMHYSADRMKLLDELEKLVRDLFSAVPVKPPPDNVFVSDKGFLSPFPPDKIHQRISIVPVKDFRYVRLVFPAPSQSRHYRTKPSNYYSHLIGHEGPGSVFALLKERGWATSLSAGTSGRYDIFEMFEVKLTLTDEGFDHRDEVLALVFSFIEIIKEGGVHAWVFNEMQRLHDLQFQFLSKAAPYSFVTTASNNMQKYPEEDYLRGSYVFQHYDADLIEEYGKYISVDNIVIVEAAKSLADKCTETEYWYKTKYCSNPIEKSLMETWSKRVVLDEGEILAMSGPNAFIPDSVELKSTAEPVNNPFDETPKLVHEAPGLAVYHLLDNYYHKPKAIASVLLMSPIVYSSPHTFAKNTLLLMLIEDSLNEYAYDADLAGLHYSLAQSANGTRVRVSGYNDKLGVLCNAIFERIKTIKLRADRLEVMRTLHREQLQNFYKPYSHAAHYLNCATVVPFIDVAERLEIVDKITVQDFLSMFLSSLHIQAFVHGNMLEDEAIALVQKVKDMLSPAPLYPHHRIKQRCVKLTEGFDHVVSVVEPNPDNENSCVYFWWQIGLEEDHRLDALTSLLGNILKDQCYNQLRTKEQLGYIVWSGARAMAGVTGYRVTVQSSVKDPNGVAERIASFLQDAKERLDKLEESEFQQFVEALIVKYVEKPHSLHSLHGLYWDEIEDYVFKFNRFQTLAEITRTLTLEDVRSHFQRFIYDKATSRRDRRVNVSDFEGFKLRTELFPLSE